MGVTNLDALTLSTGPVLPGGQLPIYTGNWYFVNETTGSDGNEGTAASPFATLTRALALCNANQNDVVAFMGTIHLTSTLVWNKNQVHLIGMCDPLKRGKRARLSAGGTAFSPMVQVTASGCQFNNFGTFYGFDSATNNVTPWSEEGGRNCYTNVEFLGFGNATVTTGTSNKTTSRALVITGSTGECTFRSCVFGVDTLSRGAANATLEIAGGSPRNYFYDCDFEAMAGTAGVLHLLIGSAGIDRYLTFVNCRFLNAIKSTATTMTQVASVSGSAGGLIMMDQCTFLGATHLETTPSNIIFINNAAPSSTADSGKAVNNTSA